MTEKSLTGTRQTDGSYFITYDGLEYRVYKTGSSWFAQSMVDEMLTEGPFKSYSEAKEFISSDGFQEIEVIATSIWDSCDPAALLCRVLYDEVRRLPSEDELTAIDNAGFAGEDGKKIDWDAVNCELNRWEELKNIKKSQGLL